jgi:hypothetical protein
MLQCTGIGAEEGLSEMAGLSSFGAAGLSALMPVRRQQGKHAEYDRANERQGNPIDLRRIIISRLDDGIWR